ncbi:hypothetical protein EVAR_63461_1 [Eumeta japonica]|uniref:Uncharacterized protein n=1 Tax=Eumeta variegata TaxID=151549 RepID=A0A4C1YCY9_EUMVA|nr:hypothetical protein EVAR_63461_1 [Eumeta japonica]
MNYSIKCIYETLPLCCSRSNSSLAGRQPWVEQSSDDDLQNSLSQGMNMSAPQSFSPSGCRLGRNEGLKGQPPRIEIQNCAVWELRCHKQTHEYICRTYNSSPFASSVKGEGDPSNTDAFRFLVYRSIQVGIPGILVTPSSIVADLLGGNRISDGGASRLMVRGKGDGWGMGHRNSHSLRETH